MRMRYRLIHLAALSPRSLSPINLSQVWRDVCKFWNICCAKSRLDDVILSKSNTCLSLTWNNSPGDGYHIQKQDGYTLVFAFRIDWMSWSSVQCLEPPTYKCLLRSYHIARFEIAKVCQEKNIICNLFEVHETGHLPRDDWAIPFVHCEHVHTGKMLRGGGWRSRSRRIALGIGLVFRNFN